MNKRQPLQPPEPIHPQKKKKCSNTIPFKEGRRFFSPSFYHQQLKLIGKHEPLDCSVADMVPVSEVMWGGRSALILKCTVCTMEKRVFTEEANPQDHMDVNTALVSAMVTTGGGYSQLQEFQAALNMPCMSRKTWSKYHTKVHVAMHDSAYASMLEAGKEEARLAILAGEVDVDGTPVIMVIGDGAWAKRSYKTNYNAASGVVVIVGYRTRKVLFIGVRNKYCSFCEYHKRQSSTSGIPDHMCFQNWKGTSTGMEADAIVEGFQQSMAMHGLKYDRLIGDGDSSVHRKLMEALPYGPNLIVKKIECRNHLLRNYIRRIREMCLKSMFGPCELRQRVGAMWHRLRYSVTRAILYRGKQDALHHVKVRELQRDIINGPSHVFGDHTNCAERGYFCDGTPKDGDINLVPELQETGMYQEVMSAVNRLSNNADSLILNVDNNAAEQYNSIVAKMTGGKRINFTLRDSFQARCNAAVVSFNSTGELHRVVHKTVTDKSPGFFTKRYTTARRNVILQTRKRKLEMTTEERYSKSKKNRAVAVADDDYGPDAANPLPDKSPEDLEIAKTAFLQTLNLEEKERDMIEERTRGQSVSDAWKNERRKRLTASKFGQICKQRSTTSCAGIVESIRYSTFSGSKDTQWGIDKEPQAIAQFEAEWNIRVQQCGLYIDPEHPYLGASPDGLIGDDHIVEVKCPASAKLLTPEEAVDTKKINYLIRVNDSLQLKPDHNYMYQIQGQLHITRRKYCYFVVWTTKGMFVQIIERDDMFWSIKMVGKLSRFYLNCLLPEIVDSRRERKRPIRDPEYIVEAQQKAKKNK